MQKIQAYKYFKFLCQQEPFPKLRRLLKQKILMYNWKSIIIQLWELTLSSPSCKTKSLRRYHRWQKARRTSKWSRCCTSTTRLRHCWPCIASLFFLECFLSKRRRSTRSLSLRRRWRWSEEKRCCRRGWTIWVPSTWDPRQKSPLLWTLCPELLFLR